MKTMRMVDIRGEEEEQQKRLVIDGGISADRTRSVGQ